MDPFKYYCVDWIIFVMVIFHMYLVGQKNKWGWICGLAASGFTMAFGLMAESLAMILMNVGFAVMHTRNFILWHREEIK